MKCLVITLVVIFTVGTLVGCSKPESRVADRNDIEAKTERQQEEIRQLQEKISQQQDEINQLKAKQPSKQEDSPIARALRRKYGKCSKVDISGEVVKIYFCNIRAVASFIDTGPETYAVSDLNFFLTETGLKTGTIEYYTSKGSEVFSISGSPSNAETEIYY